MTNSNNMTFEEVNAHVEKNFNTQKHSPAVMATATATNTGTTLCDIYPVVKPILLFVKKILPAKWGIAIDALIGALDALCPGH